MKLVIKTLSEEAVNNRDGRNAIEFYVNNHLRMSFWEGEPEDANLSRDFSDIRGIVGFAKKVYEAGKDGEALDISYQIMDD